MLKMNENGLKIQDFTIIVNFLVSNIFGKLAKDVNISKILW